MWGGVVDHLDFIGVILCTSARLQVLSPLSVLQRINSSSRSVTPGLKSAGFDCTGVSAVGSWQLTSIDFIRFSGISMLISLLKSFRHTSSIDTFLIQTEKKVLFYEFLWTCH